jgi:hypothetical protein
MAAAPWIFSQTAGCGVLSFWILKLSASAAPRQQLLNGVRYDEFALLDPLPGEAARRPAECPTIPWAQGKK